MACGGRPRGGPGQAPCCLCKGPVESPGWGPRPASACPLPPDPVPSHAPLPSVSLDAFPFLSPHLVYHVEQKRSSSWVGGARRRWPGLPCRSRAELCVSRVSGVSGRAEPTLRAPHGGCCEKHTSLLPGAGMQGSSLPSGESRFLQFPPPSGDAFFCKQCSGGGCWRGTGRALGLALGPRLPAAAGDEEWVARIWGHMVTF